MRTRRDFIKTATAAGATFGVVGALGLDAAQSGRAMLIPTERSKALMTLFGLKYPIFEAPHGRATNPDLAIAVSNAGAVGALASLASPDDTHAAVSKVRVATKQPFVVNFILARETTWLKAALDAGAPIVQFSWECRRRKCFRQFAPHVHHVGCCGMSPPGKRPGDGDVLANGSDGRKVHRYFATSPDQGLEGAITECALFAGLSVEFVKDLPRAGALVERLWRECEEANS